MNWIRRLVREEDGTTAVEYAVMIALILVVIMGAISSMGGGTGAMFGNIDGEMSSHGM